MNQVMTMRAMTPESGSFRELDLDEIEAVSGGADWDSIAAGVGVIGLGVTLLATAGLATVPVALVGAATAGELLTITVAMGLGATGGAIIGSGAGSDGGSGGTGSSSGGSDDSLTKESDS
ncbi:MAG: hypothetical protein KDI36_05295 [Pseudomonadales bacterium]|nr:hypothetical protein [Pseudomonadales bacterium]